MKISISRLAKTFDVVRGMKLTADEMAVLLGELRKKRGPRKGRKRRVKKGKAAVSADDKPKVRRARKPKEVVTPETPQ
jgi:hypothetical protein